jgi:hypothetical protein
MFEVLILLTCYGLLYVEIIEILEKCKQGRTSPVQEVHPNY